MKSIINLISLLILPLVISKKQQHLETTQYMLYTRKNPSHPIVLYSNHWNKLQERKKTIIIIHGAQASPHLGIFQKLKDAYLQRYDCNVILMDWSGKAELPCKQILKEMPIISQSAAHLFCELTVPIPESIHIVGHSLGAHLGGYIGKLTIMTCNKKIGRITGLDPTGIIFNDLSEDERLDKSDAVFVDVIHTNGGGLGYLKACGHVDFYVNCGIVQIGCTDNNCNHLRSIDYMIESVNSNDLVAQSCTECPKLNCKGDQLNPKYILMGEHCPSNVEKKVYWIPTNAKPPYGVSWTRYEAYYHKACKAGKSSQANDIINMLPN